ncbi:MAG TPA: ABC transporter ATP-binding protein [Dehalococcoidia bacterium]|nr:ABC transporter ATP-binding protein [Dehalococcoidia bacterium]
MAETSTAPAAVTTVPRAGTVAPASGPPIIELHDLVKRYGNFTAVDGVSLTVYEREIFGILGPNGAGKTTTLEMIEGLRQPDAGTIRVAGIDAVHDSEAVRRIIGVQLQTTALFDYLTSAELIALFGGLYDKETSAQRVSDLLALVGLSEKRDAKVNEMSGGQQQRLSIALALVNQPQIVFLDEPTTGLDPQARRNLWETIRGVRAAGTTVVLTTHYMEEAEYLCDRVAIMDHGQIIAMDTPAGLIRSLGMAASVQAEVMQGTLPPAALASLAAVTKADFQPESGALRLQTSNVQATLVALLDLAARHQVVLSDLRTTQANLEDVFLSLTGRKYEPGQEPEASAKPARRRRGMF